MKFWDSSALSAILLAESVSTTVVQVLKSDPEAVIWWASRAECASAILRRAREGKLGEKEVETALERLDQLTADSVVIQPDNSVMDLAIILIKRHPLAAADAMQLASGLAWCRERPHGRGFACLDNRLREAACKEGFTVLP